MSEINAFDRLRLEHERTLFMFYGYRRVDGSPGHGYFKLAHSLAEALADLQASEGVADEGGYLVRDAFLEMADGDAVLHVELISLAEADMEEGGNDD
jgi:hypothetical protein